MLWYYASIVGPDSNLSILQVEVGGGPEFEGILRYMVRLFQNMESKEDLQICIFSSLSASVVLFFVCSLEYCKIVEIKKN